MTYTFDTNVVSDLHKDAFGFRPGYSFWVEWDGCDDDGKQKIWNYLLESLKESIEENRLAEEAAIKRFEELVTNTIAAGALNRKHALLSIMDASDCDGDWEYLCYRHGLPYRYFKESI